MESFLVSTGVVALAEIGDKTQLLALLLAARFRRPLPIVLGILAATLANHALAGAAGAWCAALVGPEALRWILGLSFIAMAAWTLVPDKAGGASAAEPRFGVFGATAAAGGVAGTFGVSFATGATGVFSAAGFGATAAAGGVDGALGVSFTTGAVGAFFSVAGAGGATTTGGVAGVFSAVGFAAAAVFPGASAAGASATASGAGVPWRIVKKGLPWAVLPGWKR